MSLARAALFDIPVWTAIFDNVVPFHAEMAAEVEGLIDAAPPEGRGGTLAHQTASDPFDLPSQGWQLLHANSAAAFSALAKENFRRWRHGEFHLRRWAIRYGRLSQEEKQRLAAEALHNHLPALFSAIYYLRIPPELAGTEAGGTVFNNPLSNLMDLLSPRRTTIQAQEGKFVVFPSFVDHAPVPVHWDATDIPRIVISFDVFFVSGESLRSSDPIVPAHSATPSC